MYHDDRGGPETIVGLEALRRAPGRLQSSFLRRIRSKADAADLPQEVYVRMLRVLDLGAIRNPVLYLYTVAKIEAPETASF